MNLGIEGVGVEDTPNYMYPDSTLCVDCHLEESSWKMTPAIYMVWLTQDCRTYQSSPLKQSCSEFVLYAILTKDLLW